MMNWRGRIASVYPILSGSIFLGLGLLTLIRPEVHQYYSIGIDNASARTAMRAMIGGGEIGIGAILLGGGKFGFSVHQRCGLAAAIFTCVGTTRLLSTGFEGDLYLVSQPLREASIELLFGYSGVLAAARTRGADPSY